MSEGAAEENGRIPELLAAADRGGQDALDQLVAAVYAASTVTRHRLVDHARGAGQVPLTLEDDPYAADDDNLAVLALDSALSDIAEIDPRLEQIIECRYFAGLSVNDTPEALGMAVRTVERDWQRAKAYLLKAMETDAR